MSPKHNPTSPKGFKFSGMDSPKSPNPSTPKERFAEKGSLYLGNGRPEMTGRTDTINTTSQNNSIFLKKGSTASVGSGNNQDSFSTFSNHADKKNKSFKIHTGGNGGKNILKETLLRNIQKNNSDIPGEEYKDDGTHSPMNRTSGGGGGFSKKISDFHSEGYSSDQDPESEDDGYSQSPKHYKAPENSDKKRGSALKRRFQPFAPKHDSDGKQVG